MVSGGIRSRLESRGNDAIQENMSVQQQQNVSDEDSQSADKAGKRVSCFKKYNDQGSEKRQSFEIKPAVADFKPSHFYNFNDAIKSNQSINSSAEGRPMSQNNSNYRLSSGKRPNDAYGNNAV